MNNTLTANEIRDLTLNGIEEYSYAYHLYRRFRQTMSHADALNRVKNDIGALARSHGKDGYLIENTLKRGRAGSYENEPYMFR